MEKVIDNTPFEKYSYYKDSGMIWLGEIPEHWKILPSKRFHKVKKYLNYKRECTNVLSLTLRGVVNNDPDSPEGMVPKDYGTYQIFEKDDIVFKLIDLENIRTSRVGIVHETGIMSSAYIRLVIGNNILPKYAFYYYYCLYINEVYNNLGSGVRSTLGPNDLLSISFVKPNLNEQIAISNYLDKKIAKIDHAIDIKKGQMKLLKERNQILIHKALTRGLNPNVKMKDSGVEWIGKIPNHWKVKRLKYLLDEFNVRSTKGDEELLSLSKYYGVIPKSSLEERAGQAESLIGYKVLYPEHLVINKMQAVNGLIAVSKISGITSPDYSIYQSKNNSILNINYLCQLILQPEYLGEFKRRVTGVMEGFIRLYTDDLYDVYVHLPPIDEQNDIVESISNLTTKIYNAIYLKEKEIERLKEYKATLINSAVTGKIKVC